LKKRVEYAARSPGVSWPSLLLCSFATKGRRRGRAKVVTYSPGRWCAAGTRLATKILAERGETSNVSVDAREMARLFGKQ